jgi:dynactin 1
MMKDEMKDAEMLRTKLEMRDQDMKDMKKLIKSKQEEMSELVIRRDMVEKKLSLLTQEKALSDERWARKLEDSQAIFNRRDKEYSDALDRFQKDIDELESVKQELKTRLLAVGKLNVMESVGKIGTPGSPTTTLPPTSLPPVGSHSIMTSTPFTPLRTSNVGFGYSGEQLRVVEEERDALRRELKNVYQEYQSYKTDYWRDEFYKLKPLKVPKKFVAGGKKSKCWYRC